MIFFALRWKVISWFFLNVLRYLSSICCLKKKIKQQFIFLSIFTKIKMISVNTNNGIQFLRVSSCDIFIVANGLECIWSWWWRHQKDTQTMLGREPLPSLSTLCHSSSLLLQETSFIVSVLSPYLYPKIWPQIYYQLKCQLSPQKRTRCWLSPLENFSQRN